MAYILHIDTSGDNGTIALAHDGKLLAERVNTDTRNHAAVINVYIDELLKEQNLELKDISAIAVCGGPGSYTGLRIGLSTAKALCYALDIPMLHHDRLLLITLNKYYNNSSKYEQFACVLPARDQEHFLGIYNKKLDNVFGPRHVFEHELKKIIDEIDISTVILGKIEDETAFTMHGFIRIIKEDAIATDYWAKYAYNSYVHKNFADIAMAEPYYLKQVYTHK